MDERLRLVARRLDREKMAQLCREFGISRKTGYKIFNRHKECGGRVYRTAPSSENPFTAKLSPMSPVQTVTHVTGMNTERTLNR